MKKLLFVFLFASIFLTGCVFTSNYDGDINIPPVTIQPTITRNGDKIVENIGFTFINGHTTKNLGFLLKPTTYDFEFNFNIYNNTINPKTLYSNAFTINFTLGANSLAYSGEIYLNETNAFSLSGYSSQTTNLKFTLNENSYNQIKDRSIKVYYLTTLIQTLTNGGAAIG